MQLMKKRESIGEKAAAAKGEPDGGTANHSILYEIYNSILESGKECKTKEPIKSRSRA